MSPIASRLRGKIKEKMDQKWCRAEQRCGFDTEDKTGQKRKHREEYQRNQACKGELVRMLDLQGIAITRECLVKIERGLQHVHVQQLKGIKNELGTSYEELLK